MMSVERRAGAAGYIGRAGKAERARLLSGMRAGSRTCPAPTFCESEVSQVQEMDAGLGKRLKRF